ncbi:hypothetical protein CR513_33703, partial [Mucuna pruriens]
MWCTNLGVSNPQLEPAQSYELKSGLIHLLPKFHGLAGENLHKHLKEFDMVCSTMRLPGIPKDYIKIKACSFSLDGAAKDWLYLQPILFNTWGDMKCTFLEKFFPASRTATIRKEICGIWQHTGETLHKYWEQFNRLCATCPHHQINEQLLIQYFYEGLILIDRSMIDVASVEALMDKTPATTRHLISNMASNTQQFGIRGAITNKAMNEVGTVDNLRMENQLTELTLFVRQLAETELDNVELVGAIGGNQYDRQPYQTRQFDGHQFRRLQQYRSSLSQGQYAVPRFGPAPNMLALNHNYYQQPGPRYPMPLFQH